MYSSRILLTVLNLLVIIFTQSYSNIALSQTDSPRCAVIELYIQNNSKESEQSENNVRDYIKNNKQGLKLHVFNVDRPGNHLDRFKKIQKYFGLKSLNPPAIFTCNYLIHNTEVLTDKAVLHRKLKIAHTIAIYTRTGCDRCDSAKSFLNRHVKHQYPGLSITKHDIIEDVNARKHLHQLAKRYKKTATSVPVFHFNNQLTIGYLGEATTGKQILSKLKRWTVSCSIPQTNQNSSRNNTQSSKRYQASLLNGLLMKSQDTVNDNGPVTSDNESDLAKPIDELPLLPEEPGSLSMEGFPEIDPVADNPESIDVPIFGDIKLSSLGMPAFTVVIGLIDGFNPCAMWVLMFLLSILVNIKSRSKIIAVAGTFVVISGLAYFAFMAAWLNVFLLVGYLRSVQIFLGVMAVVIGSVHIKDYFAFKRGISLSIPESAKPGIYTRVRKIVTAENLSAAIAGAIILAVLVNIVELLCTAGLPAMYSEILILQDFPLWKNYAYLGLYNLAYMFDDLLLVSLVVITLGKHKLQEQEGRWLKLISGSAILILGLIMIIKPELLV